ncbi:hypothetical protein E4665_07125 [Sporolactobacillus shoreae]|uniref:Uncharacterized protein n=1 Tax=Sporolactobacillus shoreae TaxID=1465501 RepID=A0A4Z0GNE3_9BACL|nr:hypothetical protein [Sporolactobacillus shoreae]TGA98629.1 hypothetical protein E4665_07125 [Sporolactobacillus shoreae]
MIHGKAPNRAPQVIRNGKRQTDSGIRVKMTAVQAEIMMQLLYSLPHEAQALYKLFQPVAARQAKKPEWIALQHKQAAVLEQVVASELDRLTGQAWAQYRRERFSAGVLEAFGWLGGLQSIWWAFCEAEGQAKTKARDSQWHKVRH